MAYDPAITDGPTPTVAVSAHGLPTLGERYVIPARQGRAVRLLRGDLLRIGNPGGSQVCDFFALAADSPAEMLSMEHTRTALGRVFLHTGDRLVSTRRRAFFTLIEDTSPGIHDMLIAACDHTRYVELGCREYHPNCADNFRAALAAIGVEPVHVPCPLNLWMNIPVGPGGRISFEPPASKPGDHVVLRAEADCIAVMSACPQDLTPVNGTEPDLRELVFAVTRGRAS